MIAYCERCRRTDGDWKRAIPHLRTTDGRMYIVWRHRPCEALLAVPARVTAEATT